MARLILVSNRVAIPAGPEGRRAGGLEVALRGALKQREGIWFGWSGNVVAPGEVKTETVVHDNSRYVVTDLAEDEYQEYYNGFANRVLWPILHYRLDLAEFSRRDMSGYFRVNDYFATELQKLIEPDDLIWVHDYHLIPMAQALRARGCGNRIAFFLHVPFPPPEIVSTLPNHEQLVPALLQYDLVGFQTQGDADNFSRYLMTECRNSGRDLLMVNTAEQHLIFQIDGRQIRIGSFPAGIEIEEFRRMAESAIGSRVVQAAVKSLTGRAMVIGVDRLDYSKGLVQRLDAFERFLAGWPDWRGKVTFLQVTPKSRSAIPEYSELGQQLSAAAGRVNAGYGDASWTPIRYVNRAYSRSELAGLYRAARVGLVTPLRDGMNLVAKEYITAQNPDDPGVLILSRFAGAAIECQRALLVNPYDAESVAAAIVRALAMPLEERRARHRDLMQAIAGSDSQIWVKRFLEALEQSGRKANLGSEGESAELPSRLSGLVRALS